MLFDRTIFGRLLLAGALAISVGMLGASCGGGDTAAASTSGPTGPTGPTEITFDGESELFPSLNYSTGLLPAGSPVQASFTVTAKGSQKVHAIASPSGSQDAPTLTGLPGKGSLTLDGGFFLIGQLKVNIQGLPSYDGPIPGIDNIKIPIKGESAFDPFSIEKPVKVHADVPPTKLPPIPLTPTIPGELILEIAEGSTVDLTFTGACAGVDGATATYDGRIDRGGKLVIQPSIEIKLPLIGKKTFPIPAFSVDLALGGSTIEMSTPVGELGSEPSQGDHVKGSCKSTGSGSTTGGGGSGSTGSGGAATTGTGSAATTGTGSATTTGTGSSTTTGSGSSSSTGSGSSSSTSTGSSSSTGTGSSSSTGTGGSNGGVCDSGSTFGDTTFDTCVSDHCCQEFTACTAGGAQACNDCLTQGGGALCNPLLLCMGPCAGVVCNSELAYNGASYTEAQCLSTNCCVQFNACTMNGTQAQECVDCFNSGGGPGTICASALTCAQSSCGL